MDITTWNTRRKASDKTEGDGMSPQGAQNPAEVIIDTNTVHRKTSSFVKGSELLSGLYGWAFVNQLGTQFAFTQSLGYPKILNLLFCVLVFCMHKCPSPHKHLMPVEAGKDIGFLGTGITDVWAAK